MSQPTAYEQYMLELINRARSNPGAEAARDGIGLNDGLAPGTLPNRPAQPLAFNPDLIAAAQGHSEWMLANDTFGHAGAGGSSPGDRMATAGYDLKGSYGWGENIGLVGGTNLTLNQATADKLEGDLFVDKGEPGAGHRVNILNPDWREAGVGIANGGYTYPDGVTLPSALATQDFAYSGNGGSFLTGVAYNDLNGDAFYQPGEGLGGLAVQATSSNGQSYQTTTWGSGGYQVELPAGSYQVTFSGGALPAPVAESATVASQNVELDLVRPGGASPTPATSAPAASVPSSQGDGGASPPTPFVPLPPTTPSTPSTPSTVDGSTFGSGPDTLTVTLSEDAWQGDALASVAIDGQTLTATPLTVTAPHAAGAGETFTFRGDFGAGAHGVAVSFLNDAYGGTPATDRNLYVNKVNYNGLLPNGQGTAALYSAGSTGFTIPPANDPEANRAPPTPTPSTPTSTTPTPPGSGEYVLEGPKWSDNTITWSFASPSSGGNSSSAFSEAIPSQYQSVIEDDLQKWASVANLRFVQVPDSTAPGQTPDVRIGFADLPAPELGSTNYPYSGGNFVPGVTVALDEPGRQGLTQNSDGTVDYGSSDYSLNAAALHELGHALGLGHSPDPKSIMNITGQPTPATLNATDVAGIQALYGPPASSTPMPTTPGGGMAMAGNGTYSTGMTQFGIPLTTEG